MWKTMDLTNSILEIANVLMSKYSADIRIEMRRGTWSGEIEYIVTVAPWNSDLRTNICVSDSDICNMNVSDLISLRLDDAVKRMGANTNA